MYDLPLSTYEKFIAHSRELFGPSPRPLGIWGREPNWRVKRPAWCTAKDEFSKYFDSRDDLLRRGVIVWGQLIQANRMMFQPGPNDHPGEVIYCPDDRFENDLVQVRQAAERVAALKGTAPADPALGPIAHYLTNERIRTFGLPVPRVLSPQIETAITSVYFERAHLPNGFIQGSIFPLLVMPQQPRFAMVVPSQYWHRSFAQMWR